MKRHWHWVCIPWAIAISVSVVINVCIYEAGPHPSEVMGALIVAAGVMIVAAPVMLCLAIFFFILDFYRTKT